MSSTSLDICCVMTHHEHPTVSHIQSCGMQSVHHPFTAPDLRGAADGESLAQAKSIAYDLVYNGYEIGGEWLPSPVGHHAACSLVQSLTDA